LSGKAVNKLQKDRNPAFTGYYRGVMNVLKESKAKIAK
jgi:hypothetical protein